MNRKFRTHTYILFALILFISGCSTSRNTRVSRFYHELTARYNIFFNGNEAFEKGIERIEESLQDDYSQILPMFFYSVHDNLGKSDSDMDYAIEKGKKLIKKHSIRSKPKYIASRANDKAYVDWFRQEEFNEMVDDAYMLMGKSHFFKGDFLESIGVFNYIRRHFPNQQVMYEAQLWMARAYSEMGWYYEAEDILKKANDDNFPFQLAGEFAAITADLYLKRGLYREAIPYLKEAIGEENDKKTKRRYLYILAQIYQEAENYENAVATYNQVLRMSPPYEMEFNARIRLTEVFQGKGNAEGIKKELRKMIKDEKNQEYLDQIYYAIANLENSQGNLEAAIENYNLSVSSSAGNNIQKGLSHLTLANIYFDRTQYRDAQPHFAGAAASFGEEYPGAKKIKSLADVLNQMAGFFETIEYEDSMQMVAALTPAQQNELIDGIIAKVVEDEKKAAEAAAKGESFLNLPGESDWYFYNPRIVQQGLRDFKSSWGSRKLEDNWRRSSKMSSGFGNMAQMDNAEEDTAQVMDNKTREFYLQNIPSSEAEFKASDNNIAMALFGLGEVFRVNLNDYKQAIDYYNALINRFPKHEKALDSYFGLYQAYLKLDDNANAAMYKQSIISEFPNSRYATILSDPDYVKKLEMAKAIQDSMYEASYKAYIDGNFEEVTYNYKYVMEQYPDSKLKPNFMFLDALVKGSNQDSVVVFRSQLEALRTGYPEERVAEQAKSILAQLDAGKKLSGTGATPGSLLQKRDDLLEQLGMEEFVDSVNVGEAGERSLFAFDEDALHYFVMLMPSGRVDENQFLYEVARFNFTKFLIKDFDLSWLDYNADTTILIINGFNGLDESLWYQRTFILDESLYEILSAIPYERMVVSDRNFRALITTRDLKAYKRFYNEHIKAREGSIQDPFKKEEPLIESGPSPQQ